MKKSRKFQSLWAWRYNNQTLNLLRVSDCTNISNRTFFDLILTFRDTVSFYGLVLSVCRSGHWIFGSILISVPLLSMRGDSRYPLPRCSSYPPGPWLSVLWSMLLLWHPRWVAFERPCAGVKPQSRWQNERVCGLRAASRRGGPTNSYYQPEDDIELTDQEKEALESLRHAYLEILRLACQRRIQNLTTEFEKLWNNQCSKRLNCGVIPWISHKLVWPLLYMPCDFPDGQEFQLYLPGSGCLCSAYCQTHLDGRHRLAFHPTTFFVHSLLVPFVFCNFATV